MASGWASHLLRVTCLLLLSALPAAAQIPVVIHGRVEDATSRQPILGARVAAVDSTAGVFTDSLGAFAIQIHTGEPVALQVEQYGYTLHRFDLAAGAPRRINVLLLEPDPVVLEGVNVVTESAVTELLQDLNRRRNFYEGPLSVFDRSQLERFAPVGSALDFIRQRVPQLFECSVGSSGLCLPSRGISLSSESGVWEVGVMVCVDGWMSFGATSELESLDIRSVALLEIYGSGRGGIRVYTPGYLAHAAHTGRNIATPLGYGC